MSPPIIPSDDDARPIGVLPPELMQEAAEWHVVLHSGEAEAEEIEDFERWKQDPEHARAYAELEQVWQRFDPATEPPARRALQSAIENTGSSSLKKAGVGVCGLLFLLFGTIFWQEHSYLGADYRTGYGEQKVIELSDQSVLTLNTYTAVDISFTDNRRVIRLRQGEIDLQVAKDPSRPMTVITQHGRATALGTRYRVYDQEDSTQVEVTESRVQVCAAKDKQEASCERIEAGQATTVDHWSVEKPRSIDTHFEHDWQTRQLIVSNQPLLRVLNELDRYQLGSIQADEETLGEVMVSGVFPLNNPRTALMILEQSLPIEVSRYTSLLTVVRRK